MLRAKNQEDGQRTLETARIECEKARIECEKEKVAGSHVCQKEQIASNERVKMRELDNDRWWMVISSVLIVAFPLLTYMLVKAGKEAAASVTGAQIPRRLILTVVQAAQIRGRTALGPRCLAASLAADAAALAVRIDLNPNDRTNTR